MSPGREQIVGRRPRGRSGVVGQPGDVDDLEDVLVLDQLPFNQVMAGEKKHEQRAVCTCRCWRRPPSTSGCGVCCLLSVFIFLTVVFFLCIKLQLSSHTCEDSVSIKAGHRWNINQRAAHLSKTSEISYV